MVYCLCYGVTNKKAKGYFLVSSAVISSNAKFHSLGRYPSGKLEHPYKAILIDLPFKIAALISKRILIEMGTNVFYKIRSPYL